MPEMLRPKLLSWGSDVEDGTLDQAARAANMPFIVNHVALMPDAHIGMGATIGSVLPTQGAIIPAAVGVDIGCVDKETEFLSPSGWKKISEWDDDLVAQYSLTDDMTSFVKPVYVKRPSDGFYRIKTKYGVDQMVSKDHRMLIFSPHNRDRHWLPETIRASEFVNGHNGHTHGTKSRFLTVGGSIQHDSSIGLSNADIRVAIMVNADGHQTQTRRGAVVVKLRKERKIDRCRKLLNDANLRYTENIQGNGDVAFRFVPFMEKDDWAELWRCSRYQLEVIFDEVLHWDGNHDGSVFYTRNEKAADFMQYVFFANGYRAVKRSDRRGLAIDYRVYAHSNTLVGIESSPNRNDIRFAESEDGYEYCFQVPTTYWVMRRNGQIAITGNCGMIAVETTLTASDLPDDLTALHNAISLSIPAGVGKGHHDTSRAGALIAENDNVQKLGLADRAAAQMGTLGSGNHFVEVCLDGDDHVWVVLHSGSRGVGNKLAMRHIKIAKGLMKQYFIDLDDPDLAYFVEGTREFAEYMRDLHWAQDYALANRETMMDAVLKDLWGVVGERLAGSVLAANDFEKRRINCHHNYTAKEHHYGKDIWVTRKGAIRAREGDYGVIPGSMGTNSYIVKGLGNKSSFNSSAHGAGRRMSRTRARKELSVGDLEQKMAGKAWNNTMASKLLDEHPDSYKDIESVMRDQADLVEVVTELHQVLNYKGA